MIKLEIPEGLSEETRNYIQSVKSFLSRNRVIENIDLGALRMLMTSYEMYVRASENLIREGPTIIDYKGAIVVNPNQEVAQKNYIQITKIMTEYGLTIKSRQKMTLNKPNAVESPVDEYFAKKAKAMKERR